MSAQNQPLHHKKPVGEALFWRSSYSIQPAHFMKSVLLCSALLASSSVALAAAPAPTTVQVASNFERVEALPNGLKFVSKIDRIAPRMALSLQVRVGASDESAPTAGWRRLYAGAVARGVPVQKDPAPVLSDDSDGLNIARKAEALGGDAGISVGDDTIEFWATGDSASAPQLLELLVSMWKSSRLSDEDIAASRTSLTNQIDAQDLDFASQTSQALRTQEFVNAKGEPVSYGLSEIGTTQSLENLTPARVRELGKRVANSPATLCAVGDVDVAGLRAVLETLPAPTIAPAAAPTFAPIKTGKPALVVRDVPTPTAWVFISYPLGRVKPEDAPALRLLSAALSDIPDARLTKRLMGGNLVDGAPAALSLSSQFVFRRDGSELLLSAQTSASRVEKVKNALIEEVSKLKSAPLSAREFALARDFARGDWALSHQSLRDRAFLVGQSPAVGGAPDGTWPARLAALSPASAQAAARRSFGSYAVALVMPRS